MSGNEYQSTPFKYEKMHLLAISILINHGYKIHYPFLGDVKPRTMERIVDLNVIDFTISVKIDLVVDSIVEVDVVQSQISRGPIELTNLV